MPDPCEPGHAFNVTMGMAGEDAPEPLGSEFRQTYNEQNLGAATEEALRGLSRRVPLIDVRFFVSAVLMQREVGGNLAEILDNLAEVIRERFRIKGHVRAVSAHGRLTATILVIMPLGLLACLMFVAPSYLQTLAEDEHGQYLIIYAIAAQFVGIYFIRADCKDQDLGALEGVYRGLLPFQPSCSCFSWRLSPSMATVAMPSPHAFTSKCRPTGRCLANRPTEGRGKTKQSESSKRLAKSFRYPPATPALLVGFWRRRGYRSDHALPVYFGVQLLLALTLLVLATISRPLVTDGAISGIVWLTAAGLLGYFGPSLWLDHQVTARRERIRFALPDALDLLVVGVEAGLGLDQALKTVATELYDAHPDISDEFKIVNLEMRAGTSRAEALRNLSRRTGERSVRQLTGIMIQSDRFGTSMAAALRTHSDFLRLRRRQEAEERANKVGVKLVFPIFFFILPSMLIVAAGSGVLQLVKHLLPIMRSFQGV